MTCADCGRSITDPASTIKTRESMVYCPPCAERLMARVINQHFFCTPDELALAAIKAVGCLLRY